VRESLAGRAVGNVVEEMDTEEGLGVTGRSLLGVASEGLGVLMESLDGVGWRAPFLRGLGDE